MHGGYVVRKLGLKKLIHIQNEIFSTKKLFLSQRVLTTK